jgi:excinuclease UvrABC ATPase subunit
LSFNQPEGNVHGVVTLERGDGKSVEAGHEIHGGMCPGCEGMGTVSDIDLAELYDESKSLVEGAITIPGYKADGWMVRMFTESGFLDPDKPTRKYTKKELHDFLHREPTR